MKRSIFGISLALAVFLFAPDSAGAQETTERYIPIGESPGVSGSESVIGTIDSVDRDDYTMVLRTAEGTREITVAEGTRYYLDHSKIKRPNQMASFDDCTTGQRVEVKFGEAGKAEWVKIEAT